MIFVTDAFGKLVYSGSEWRILTGQAVSEAMGWGWLARVHPNDRATVKQTIDTAVATAAEFSVRYRLLRPDDTPRWVGSGGLPSFGVQQTHFSGYLGSITELAEGALDAIDAYGNVERFVPPKPHVATMPSDDLDLIADYLILAHSLIESDGVKAALPGVRSALWEVGIALAKRSRGLPRALN